MKRVLHETFRMKSIAQPNRGIIPFVFQRRTKAIRSWKLIFQIDTCRSPFQRRGLRYHQACSYSTKRRGTGGGCSGDIEKSQGVRATRRRDFMGEPGFAVAEAIKKLGARFQDTAGIGCVLPKAGKRRDGARMSGANGSPSFCQFQLTFVPRIRSTKPQAFLHLSAPLNFQLLPSIFQKLFRYPIYFSQFRCFLN